MCSIATGVIIEVGFHHRQYTIISGTHDLSQSSVFTLFPDPL